MPVIIAPPPADIARRTRELIGDAFALIDAGDPELGQEIRVLVRELVLGLGSENELGLQFDGISAFMLWGGVVLNVSGYKSVLDAVQALAHESGTISCSGFAPMARCRTTTITSVSHRRSAAMLVRWTGLCTRPM